MNGRARPFILAAAAAFALVGAACGGGGGGGASPSGPGASASAAGLGNFKGQSLTVAGVWTGAEQSAIQKVLAAFDQQTGASTTFASAGSTDMTTFLGTKIQGGNPPDVAFLPNPGLATQFVQQGVLKPIDDVVGSQVDQNWGSNWRQLGTFNGKLYGLFFKAANKSTFWYNKQSFSQAGVQPPTDWPGLVRVAGTVSDSGTPPFAIDGGSGWPLTDWFENVYIRTAGPDMYDKLTKHEIKWTDPTVTTALQTLAQVWKSDWILGGTGGALQATFPTDTGKVFASPPQAAMTYEGNFVQFAITSGQQNAAFFQFPSINGSQPSIITGADMAVLLKDSPAAKALMKYLATPQAAEIWAKVGGGFISPNKQVPTSVYPDANTRLAAQQLTQAQTVRFDMSDLQPAAFGGTTGQGEFKGFQDFLRNPSDTQGVQSYLEAQATKAYGG